MNPIASSTVLEITVGHWPFFDQFQHLANQNPFWLANFTVHFQWDDNEQPTKCLILKMANQFVTYFYNWRQPCNAMEYLVVIKITVLSKVALMLTNE